MKELSFGVAVVTCNRLNLLKECVDAINNQEVPFSKIAIVNNNSNDGTKEFLDSISDERYCIVHSSENLGGAGGFHLALKQFEDQSIDWVLIIDDDAIIRPDFIKEMKKEFKYIILDTPPLQAVTDAQVLSTKADGVLLVVRAGSTKREMVLNSVDLIKKVQGKVIGTVLNGVENKKNNYYYYGE